MSDDGTEGGRTQGQVRPDRQGERGRIQGLGGKVKLKNYFLNKTEKEVGAFCDLKMKLFIHNRALMMRKLIFTNKT